MDIELLYYPALFFTGLVAGLINVMAGGGSALVMGLLIGTGMEAAMANGTNRVAIFVQNISGSYSFKREKVADFRRGFILALWTLPGCLIGAYYANSISSERFEFILGIVLVGVILSMVFSPVRKNGDDLVERRSKWIYPAMFGIGFYGGFIQVGVGFIFMAALHHLLRIDLVRVNMLKIFIVLIYTVPVLLIFLWNGNIDWSVGLLLAAGNSTGAWWAARLSVRKGETWIRYALLVALLLMAVKFLNII